ncbi:Acidic fibroblast growth factor intracellular-binding protein [Hondaea fermentalgiana]|uniref:Acidic fibroblast growth factor intracellular-binding protein n=1 Tax=Hondaea fermentalgiana TaxID=2315210 RepID=A0A2R5G5S1_9STRA|nr:Acidic fibroblast growth factor intracellular-binding protein [Hondaea fermentalgiana]|eukprot:GBG25885.1 Acidic fibroblast growth factor intracellular-binding protein [Hondaea fermentalgiana]
MLQEAVDSSKVVFHVAQTEPVAVNLAVFDLWLFGLREDWVVYFRRTKLGSEPDPDERQLLLLLYRDSVDQYRLYELLEERLYQPQLLRRQMLVQLSPRVQQYIVRRYYEFNDNVYRELLGRKLSTRARKDLDEVAENAGVLLPSCRRQFDNLRRIYMTLDERNFEGNVMATIADVYLIPLSLAERYTCIVFLLYNRFHPLSTRKRTHFLSLADLEYCAALMLIHWVAETPSAGVTPAFVHASFTGRQYFENPSLSAAASTHGTQTSERVARGDDDGGMDEDDKDDDDDDVDDGAGGNDDEGDGDEKIPNDAGENASAQNVGTGGGTAGTASIRQQQQQQQRGRRRRWRQQQQQEENSATDLAMANHEEEDDGVHGAGTLPETGDNEESGESAASEDESKSPRAEMTESAPQKVQPSLRKFRQKGLCKAWVKSLVNIGAGLAQAKELHDLFEDISQQLCEPLQNGPELSLAGVRLLLDATNKVFTQLKLHSHEWAIYMNAMAPMCLRVYSQSSRLSS